MRFSSCWVMSITKSLREKLNTCSSVSLLYALSWGRWPSVLHTVKSMPSPTSSATQASSWVSLSLQLAYHSTSFTITSKVILRRNVDQRPVSPTRLTKFTSRAPIFCAAMIAPVTSVAASLSIRVSHTMEWALISLATTPTWIAQEKSWARLTKTSTECSWGPSRQDLTALASAFSPLCTFSEI